MGFKGQKAWNRITLDKNFIKDLYLNQNIKVSEIAKKLSVSQNTIYLRLKEMGITKSNSESHIGLQVGNKNPNWKGGRHNAHGYIALVDGKGGLIYEHRVIAKKILGRLLSKDEVVHHINGNPKDNRPENLEIISSHSEHMKKHLDHQEAVRRGKQTKRSKATLLAVMEKKDDH